MASAACWANLLGAEPFHHVAGVSTMPTGQAEVGRTSHRNVADGALECKAFADGTLSATHFAAALAAVEAELCWERAEERLEWGGRLLRIY